MLIFKEFFKTQSDQNIYQNVPINCTKFSKFSQASSIYAQWCSGAGTHGNGVPT